jgi:VIT1/CCC1 family predicted Fe2+/Mn2+ transporter
MTQAEIEAEIARLQERLSRIEHEQGANASERLKLASMCRIISIAFAAGGLLFAVAQFAVAEKLTSPLSMPFILTAIALGLLGRSFQLAPSR